MQRISRVLVAGVLFSGTCVLSSKEFLFYLNAIAFCPTAPASIEGCVPSFFIAFCQPNRSSALVHGQLRRTFVALFSNADVDEMICVECRLVLSRLHTNRW